MRWLTGLRALIYATGFLAFWGWLALSAQRLDRQVGVQLPPASRPVGAIAIVLGGLLVLACVAVFVVRGRGTPAPFDPPREFVAVGPYRIVRNPMYVGGLLVLAGFALWRRSPSILALAVVFVLAAHLFVVLFEEPQLERRFRASYLLYKQTVRRWLPRWRRSR